jgi:segregation and condensation protein B
MTEAPSHEPREDEAPEAEGPRVPRPPRPFDADPAEESRTVPAAELEPEEAAVEVIEEAATPEAGEPFEDLSELPALLEALLFVADHPLDEGYLARALEVSTPRIRSALETLGAELRDGNRGIRLQIGPEGAQLVSAPEAAARVEHFLGLEANRRLSTASLETLAIIAYRQPVTRGQVDAIRGVSSDGAIQTLRARGLIEPAGHAAGPGRPMLLRTTQRFLEHFGLERPGQLPPLPDDIDLPASEISEQLGLDEALVEQALAEATAEPETEPPVVTDSSSADADAEITAPDAWDAGEGVEISRDLGDLTAAAEQALVVRPVDEGERPNA